MTMEWADGDFDQMPWHDNAVHGIRIIEGQHGSGELALDLDYMHLKISYLRPLVAPQNRVFLQAR